jgi:uncharacterized membrane protein YdbT with pleckstrin-like domain
MTNASESGSEEKTLCEVSPSQLLNFRSILVSLFAMAIIITAAILTQQSWVYYLLALPLLYAFWKWLEIRSTRLKLTDQRLIIRQGVFSKRTNETELYRVRDSMIEEPFFYRLFGCGNLVLYTTDEAEGTVKLTAYKKPHQLKDLVRNHSEICRQKKRWGTDNILLHDHPA